MILSHKDYYILTTIPGALAIFVFAVCLLVLWSYVKTLKNAENKRTIELARFAFGVAWREVFIRLIVCGYFIQQAISQSTFPPTQPHFGSNVSRFLSSLIVLMSILITTILQRRYLRRANDELATAYERDVRTGVREVLTR